MLELTSFKTTQHRSKEQFSAEMELLGGMTQCIGGRDTLMYFVDVLRPNLKPALSLLADTVLHPSIDTDIAEGREVMQILQSELPSETFSKEALLQAAYKDQPLGQSFLCPPDLVETITTESVEQFRRECLFGENIVLAAAGVDHAFFVSLADELFGHLPSKPLSPVFQQNMPSKFIGGLRVDQRELKEPFAKACMAFEMGGWSDPMLVPSCVLQQILGVASSFSAGGPGKGMYSRLYSRVLPENMWMDSANSFTQVFRHNGLLGIDVACPPEYYANAIMMILAELTLFAYEKVGREELERAKNLTKSSLLMQLESRYILCEDIARQFGTFGRRISPTDMCELVDKVTADDIMAVGRRLARCDPAVSFVGPDVSKAPTYQSVLDYTKAYRKEVFKKHKITV